MLHPITAFIAVRYLGTKRKNRFAAFVSIVSILGIALGVAVLIIVSSVMNGFEKEVTRHILGMTPKARLAKILGSISLSARRTVPQRLSG